MLKFMPKASVPKESALESYLVDRVKALGGECLKFTSPGRRGVPDRLILLPGGVSAFVELKRFGAPLAPLQECFRVRCQALGHIAVWADQREQIDGLLEHLTGTFSARTTA